MVRELQEVQRAVDVHLVGAHRRELRARRQQRGQMEDQIDFELREDALEKPAVDDRSGEFPAHQPRQRRLERSDVERNNRPAFGCQAREKPVADFAVGPRNQNRGCAHGNVFVGRSLRSGPASSL